MTESNSTSTASPWVPEDELCADLDCTPRTLRRYKARRLLPFVEAGGKLRVPRAAWERLKVGLPPVPPDAGQPATT